MVVGTLPSERFGRFAFRGVVLIGMVAIVLPLAARDGRPSRRCRRVWRLAGTPQLRPRRCHSGAPAALPAGVGSDGRRAMDGVLPLSAGFLAGDRPVRTGPARDPRIRPCSPRTHTGCDHGRNRRRNGGRSCAAAGCRSVLAGSVRMAIPTVRRLGARQHSCNARFVQRQ